MRVLTGLSLSLLLLPACAVSNGEEPAAAAPATQAAARRGPPQISFGRRGELIIDGKPRFIRGGYRSGQEDRFAEALRSAADSGLDRVHDYRI